MEKMKEKLRKITEESLINEIRFIDTEELEPKEVFHGRQPQDLMPDAKSLIITSVYIAGFYLPDEDLDIHGRMSRLTLSGFYFNVVEPLTPLQDYLISQGYKAMVYDGMEDDDDIPLKAAAAKAGLGWIGKNTLLVSKEYGSFQALGGIITNADLAEIYETCEDHCGSCMACINSCPTRAIAPRKMDRTKCLSNLLEEDNMPESITEMPGNFFFECDICQEACPWDKKHLNNPLKTRFIETFTKQKELLELFRFDSLLNMDEKAYHDKILPLLSGVALSYDNFQRNVKLAYHYKHK